jgi:hypothetical protein
MANHFSSLGMGSHGASWSAGGYSGCGNVDKLVGTLRGCPAVVCGSANGVFEDLEFLRRAYGLDLVVFGVNDVGMYLPRMDHWVSLHDENLPAWKTVRWLHEHKDENVLYHGINPKLLKHEKDGHLDYAWDLLTPLMALSGYFAMQVAWIMGCQPIILAGCPGDRSPRFFEYKGRTDFQYGSGHSGSDVGIRQQLINEMNRVPEFKDVVRSTSGWTRDFFGGV